MKIPDSLFSEGAPDRLAMIREWLLQRKPVHQLLVQLRRILPAEEAGDWLEQAQCQLDGETKFPAGLASRMLFTRKSLEQATSRAVARYKAGLIPSGWSVADLCCGLGGDLMSLAVGRTALGVDLDPVMVRIARHNLEVSGLGGTMVLQGDCLGTAWNDADFVHIDPDRRKDSGRTVRPEWIQPSWEQLRQRIGDRPAAVKLAPATRIDPGQSDGVHCQWIGYRRECREQLAWLNMPGRVAGVSTATVVVETGESESLSGEAGLVPEWSGKLEAGVWIMEPHAAVYAAQLTGALANQHGLYGLSMESPYLVGSGPCASGLVQQFRVEETGSLDRKRVNDALRRFDAGVIEWKQRGLKVSEFSGWQKLRGNGSTSVAMLLFRRGSQLSYALCRRESSAAGGGTG